MEAAAVNLNTFFTSTEKFIIPAYQRRYSWEECHCKDLFEDILNLQETGEHLLGSVIYQTRNRANGLNLSEIVDGQQRITTLSLLLKAIQAKFQENNDEINVSRINNYLFYQSGINEKEVKIQLGNMDNNDFKRIINNQVNNYYQPLNPKLLAAYNYFIERINSLELPRLFQYFNDLISNATIIRIKIDRDLNAYKLFEATNNRGRDLTHTDLIKNFLLGNVAEIADSQNNRQLLDDAIEDWTQIIRNIEYLKSEDAFLRHFLISKFRRTISEKEITGEFKILYNIEVNNNDGDVFPFQIILNDLKRLSNVYKNINNSSFVVGQDYINRYCDNLKAIQCVPAYSFLMNLYDPANNFDQTTTITVSKLIESFMLRLHICSVPTGQTDSIFAGLMNSFDFKNDSNLFIQSIKTRLNQNSPDDDEFQRRFSSYNFKTGNISRARYILESIYYRNQGGRRFLEIGDTGEIHVEHILPQRRSSRFPNDDLAWTNQLGENFQIHYDSYIHKIGNLTLLEQPLNQRISNSIYRIKRDELQDSVIPQTREIAEQNINFDYNIISNRSAAIGQIALELWPLIIP
ncbi:MAG: hypothetical protein RL422_229 [Bacteroidota bacterium]|jgi:uncharacterized protein with ParB-like and HNH nuclease domain